MNLNILGKIIKSKQKKLNLMVSFKGLADPSVLLLSQEIDIYIVEYYRQVNKITEPEISSKIIKLVRLQQPCV